YGACFLKRSEQILLLKFFDFTDPMNPIPYVDTTQLGGPYGLEVGQLNVPQNPTYSSDFNVGFTLGGACGDVSWVEAGDPPILSVHSPGDQFAPYDLDNVLEPINDLSVIDTAAGGFAVVARANEIGNNDIWQDLDWRDPFNKAAAALNTSLGQTGVDGLYPLGIKSSGVTSQCVNDPGAAPDSATDDIAPYDWIDSTSFVMGYDDQMGPISGVERYCQITLNNPNDPVVARTYIDSVVGYLSPRIAFALGVVSESDVAVPTNLDDELASQLSIFPNPVQDQINIVLDGLQQIDEVTIMNTNGQIMREVKDIRSISLQIDREGLSSGMYLIKVRSGDLVTHQKVLLD
ncbi:MAG: T9SS type A sorting domain-containing protein, partial [Bacteroidota bacterium]